jgi:hypothetical protein
MECSEPVPPKIYCLTIHQSSQESMDSNYNTADAGEHTSNAIFQNRYLTPNI